MAPLSHKQLFNYYIYVLFLLCNFYFLLFRFMLENKVSISFFPSCCIGFQVLRKKQGNNVRILGLFQHFLKESQTFYLSNVILLVLGLPALLFFYVWENWFSLSLSLSTFLLHFLCKILSWWCLIFKDMDAFGCWSFAWQWNITFCLT